MVDTKYNKVTFVPINGIERGTFDMTHGGKRPGAGRKRKIIASTEEINPPINEKVVKRGAFTTEQIEKLKASPHIRHVTDKTISYTIDFKEYFWKRYNEGITPPQIFMESGLDLDIIGDTRIYGLLSSLRKTKERGEEFTDGREPTSHQITEEEPEPWPKPPRLPPYKKLVGGTLDETEVRKLLHQVAYLTQELEFVKKIISLGKGGGSK